MVQDMFNRAVYSLFAILLFLVSCQTNSMLVDNISDRDANEIVVLLNSKGIMAQKVAAPRATTGGAAATAQFWNIMVPAAKLTESIAILNDAGLPRVKGTTLLDLFGTAGLVPSDLQDRIRYQEGLSEQLATTIRKMDGVLDADVQITFPQSDEDNKNPLTASVYVKHRGTMDSPNSLLVTKIKRLVSSSLPGLSIDNVTVVTDKAAMADVTQNAECLAEEKSYVSLWGITIGRDSVGLFRLIFYTLLILLFLLLAALLWLLWKLWPLIEREGGPRTLLDPEPYRVTTVETTTVVPPEEM
jgi:type III secretion protein J